MTRFSISLCAALIGFSGLAMASEPQVDAEAKLHAQAEQACNVALDENRFGDYTTMDDCVSDMVVKIRKSNAVAAAKQQPVVLAHAGRPN